jgi:hypothetical protein
LTEYLSGTERLPDAVLFRMRTGSPFREATLAHDFADLRELVFPGEQTLVRLREAMQAAIVAGCDTMANVFAIAEGYVDFVRDHPRRWSMLMEHSLASGKELPAGTGDARLDGRRRR